MGNPTRRKILKSVGGSALVGGMVGTVNATQTGDLKQKEFNLATHEDPFDWPHPGCGEYSDAYDFIGNEDPVSWPEGDVGYDVAEKSADSAGIDPTDFNAAADAWDELTADIALTSGGDDITIKFGGVDGKSGKFFARAVVSYNERTREIVNASILLEPIENWKVFSGDEQCPTPKEGPNAYDVQSILTHEIGHALGLAHPSLNEENRLLTMSPVPAYRLTYWRSPDGGDVTGIQTLYGTPDSS